MFSNWASALHSTISQATEAVSAAQEVAYEASKDFFTIENAQTDEDLNSVLPDDPLTPPTTISPQHWEVVLEVAFSDSNFFVIPPSQILSVSQDSLSRIGMLDVCRSIPENLRIVPEVVSKLASNNVLAKTHYEVMPRYVSDQQFWQHCLWRLSVLRKCTSVNQLVDTYEMITFEPEPLSNRQRLRGIDNSEFCSLLRTRALAAQENVDWLCEKQRAVDESLRNAGGSCQLLNTLIAKCEQTDLSDSVFESCKYHKTKLAALIGELESNSGKLLHSELDTEGERFRELIQQNVDLSNVISSYTRMIESLKSGASDPTDLNLASSKYEESAKTCESLKTTTKVDDSDDEFNAKLPWDEEECD